MADEKQNTGANPGAPAAPNAGADPAAPTTPPATPAAEPAKTKAKPVRMLRIVAKRDGFRRCGVSHPEAPTLHDLKRFTKEEREILEAERWLIVDEVLVDPVTMELV